MEHTKFTLAKLNAAVLDVRSRKFIIASINAEGTFSIATDPVRHASLSQATAEADRLANLNPGKVFVAMQLASGSLVPKAVGIHKF